MYSSINLDILAQLGAIYSTMVIYIVQPCDAVRLPDGTESCNSTMYCPFALETALELHSLKAEPLQVSCPMRHLSAHITAGIRRSRDFFCLQEAHIPTCAIYEMPDVTASESHVDLFASACVHLMQLLEQTISGPSRFSCVEHLKHLLSSNSYTAVV